MTTRTKLEIAAGIVFLLIALLYIYQAFQKAVDVKTATIVAAHDQEADKKLNDRLDKIDQTDRQRQKDYEAKTQSLQKMTPQQIVVKVPEYIPQATAPIQIQPNGDALVPASDVKPIAQAILDGNKCKEDLVSCAQARQVWEDKYNTKTDEAKRWELAAKGGSVWKRVGKTMLYLGVGAGIGYAAHR